MDYRERLQWLWSKGLMLATMRRVRLAGQLLVAAGIVFVLLRLREIWGDSHLDVAQVGWWWLGGALAVAFAAVVGESLLWLSILRGLGMQTRRAWAGIYLQAQLGKYVPGAFWQYAGRGALARAHGLPLPVVVRSLPIELAAAMYAAAVSSLFLIGWWGVAGVVAVAGVTALVASRLPDRWAAVRAGARTIPYYTVMWATLGASFWMTAHAFVHVPSGQLPIYTGSFATAWIVGLVAIYAPGGLGVREAILVALLHGRIGSADAVIVAAASRGVLTLADLLTAGVGLVALRRLRSQGSSSPPGDHSIHSFESSRGGIPAQPLDRE
jgi:glycosyltransferase 2 family protein